VLRVFDLHLPLEHDEDDLRRKLAAALGIPEGDLLSWRIVNRAVDARKKGHILLCYTVDAEAAGSPRTGALPGGIRIAPPPDERGLPPEPGTERLLHRPVIVGTGPAGLFAGLTLARAGYRPLLLERGKPVEQRLDDVRGFLHGGPLDPESNILFGEGGAGTFSDGKLYTLIRDDRLRKVYEELAAAGAPAEILISGKPHVGTDHLRKVVRNIRETIVAAGGEMRFEARVSSLRVEDGRVTGARFNGIDDVPAGAVILAVGHSARDTFAMLHGAGLRMAPKPFSIGLRIEHLQEMVDRSQYGSDAGHPLLGAAEYKLAWHGSGGRSAYTFCMCPGGVVVPAMSEPDSVCTNGMSFYDRSGRNANGALLVNVGPADFGDSHPLAGVEFQRRWEREAFRLGGGNHHAPVQRVGAFLAGKPTKGFGKIEPTYRPGVRPADLACCLPSFVVETLRAALPAFDRKMKGFANPDAILTGVETRSSSPVRIGRDEGLESSIRGLYPAGEGAGHAGGIVSAAVDGIRCAEAVIRRYAAPS
jgi:uncharacterized FAD-dependent dehydrogenase